MSIIPQNSSTELANFFIKNSATFFNDKQNKHLDKKHRKIINSAYELIRTEEAFSEENFRNWTGQSDLPTPAQLNHTNIKAEGLLRCFFIYLLKKILRYKSESMKHSSLMDDFFLVSRQSGLKFIKDNPVSTTPGVSNSFRYKGCDINFRWLRYIYLCDRILKFSGLGDKFTWVDVGTYYGGLQGLVKKYRPNAKIIMVDFNHQLCRSFIYLSKLYPDATHIMPDALDKNLAKTNLPEGSFVYVPVEFYDKIENLVVDLFSNFFSFGEMTENILNGYLSSEPYRNAKFLYLVNRVVSSPAFEQVYDNSTTILDYHLDLRKLEYFDLFPIHNYNVIDRPLFGRKAPRNFSSNYFEALLKN